MTKPIPLILVLDSAAETRDSVALFKATGVHAGGFEYMAPKFRYYLLKARALDHRAANILKQELLSLGHDAAVPEDVSWLREGSGDAVFSLTEAALRRLAPKLREQPFGLRSFAAALEEAVEGCNRRHAFLPLPGGRKLDLSRPALMGVLNLTPDSFSDGGVYEKPENALRRALEMAEQGADILDLGGESSRPGAAPVSEDEELRRVIPALKALRKKSALPVSVDTVKAAVARAALDGGADMINDISAGTHDPAMLPLAAERRVPLLLMHMQGRPQTMQEAPAYEDVLFDVADFLRGRMEAALAAGVHRDMLVLDPGIGFGKTLEHNLILLRHLGALRSLGRPLLAGVSRKSFIGKLTGADSPAQRLEGTLAAEVCAVLQGASLLRTHEPAASRRALAVAEAIASAPPLGGEGAGHSHARRHA